MIQVLIMLPYLGFSFFFYNKEQLLPLVFFGCGDLGKTLHQLLGHIIYYFCILRALFTADEPELKREDIRPILKHPEDSPVVLRPKKTNPEKRVTSLDLSLFSRPGSGGEGRPFSVAERVNGLETLLSIKKDDFSLR